MTTNQLSYTWYLPSSAIKYMQYTRLLSCTSAMCTMVQAEDTFNASYVNTVSQFTLIIYSIQFDVSAYSNIQVLKVR